MSVDRCDVCGGEFVARVRPNKQSGDGGGGASFACWSEPGRGLVQVCSAECLATRADVEWEPPTAFLARWYPMIEEARRRELWVWNRRWGRVIDVTV